MSKYQAYPEYKRSEQVWLGDIPSHWLMKKHKYVASFVKGKNPISLEDKSAAGMYPYLSMESLRGKSQAKYALFSKGMYLAKAGQPLIIWDGSNAGEFIRAKNGILSSTMAAAELIYPLNLSYYWYTCLCLEPEMRRFANGMGIPHVDSDKLKQIILVIPSVNEQTQIANFLDHETAKIDALIEKQQQLISLLQEKRQAVISHAVTKGLNPDVPMKDSGVEWLGPVPEHWEISKLKWKAQTTSGGTPSTSKYEMYYDGGDIPWIRTTDLNNEKLFATPISITKKALADTACSILPKGSVLLAMYGGAGSIGKHSLLMFEATINQAVCGIYPSTYFESEFLHYFYEFYRPFWMINAAGTRKDPNIGQDHIKEAKITLPPKHEQKAIVAYIHKALDLLNMLNDKAIEAIQLMNERRTALISAAVTGKIDVRNWQAPSQSSTTSTEEQAL